MSSKAALSDDKRDLSELGGKEKSVGATERVLRSAGANINEEPWKRFDMTVLVSGNVCHVHVTNNLTFNSSEINRLLL